MRCSDARSRPHEKFTPADDEKLRSLVETHGTADWLVIAEQMNDKNGRQCKERWLNYLAPELNTAAWGADEDSLLMQKYGEFGSKWVAIAKFFPNRTDAMVKNRFSKIQRLWRRQRELLIARDPRFFNIARQIAAAAQSAQVKEASAEPETYFEPEDLGSDFWGDSFAFCAFEL
jgi:hypothetical protein